MFAFISNFSATKFYSAAQSGTLTGSQPHTIGALFSARTLVDFSSDFGAHAQAIFGNAVFGTSGTGIRLLQPGTTPATQGRLEFASGTINLPLGSGSAAPDGTYSANEDAILTTAFAGITGQASSGAADGDAAYTNIKPNTMVYAIMLQGATTVDCFVNGHHVAQVTDGPVTNANPFRIGIEGGGVTQFADAIDIAGVFYHDAAMTEAQIRQMVEAAQVAERVTDTQIVGGSFVPDYIWDVKTGNPDGRENWASVGAQASINMVRNAAFSTADFYAANRPWYTVGS